MGKNFLEAGKGYADVYNYIVYKQNKDYVQFWEKADVRGSTGSYSMWYRTYVQCLQ